MGEFSLPTNIRQIGSIGDGLRIYMEDYVFTYLHQFAESGGYEERAAYLVGRHMVIDGQQVLFVNGAVQGKDMDLRDGLLLFTEKSNAYAEAMIKEYFKGMEIVGWMQSQPSYGVYLNQQYGAYHRHVFPKEYQVMFVMDPLEKTNSFYAYHPEREAMAEVRGYFVYYDKNKNMHEYMLRDRAADKIPHPSAYVEVFGEDMPAPEEDNAARAEEMIRRRADERSRKRSEVAQKRSMNLMAGLSAALFVICFVMGAGLIQNRDRIYEMESQVTQLNTAYRNLLQLSGDGTAQVFAAQEDTAGQPADISDSSEFMPDVFITEPDIMPDAANDAPAATDTQEASLPADVPAADAEPSALQPEDARQAAVPPTDIQPEANLGTDDTVTEETGAEEDMPEEVFVFEEENTQEAAGPPEAYTIQAGDSLLAISLRFYGDAGRVDDILALNGMTDPDKIVTGKTIALPRP